MKLFFSGLIISASMLMLAGCHQPGRGPGPDARPAPPPPAHPVPGGPMSKGPVGQPHA